MSAARSRRRSWSRRCCCASPGAPSCAPGAGRRAMAPLLGVRRCAWSRSARSRSGPGASGARRRRRGAGGRRTRVFAALAVVLMRRRAACGCFGENDSGVRRPVDPSALLGLRGAGGGSAGPARARLGARPPAGHAAVLLLSGSPGRCTGSCSPTPSAAGLGGMERVTGEPPTERSRSAVGGAARAADLAAGALARAALAGSAFAVAPVRYLIRPGTAWAVIGPGTAARGSKCTDGYTAFCCEIEHGHNTCPPNTYVAGWWKCTDYRGHGLCHEQGVRYYLDCNRIPGTVFPGGCQCANGDCAHRRGRLQPLPLRAVQHADRRHDRGRVPAGDLPEPGDGPRD